MSEMSEEQSRHLQDAQERQLQSETYLAELRMRMVKLADRNAWGEAYIQDLETKLKTYADKEDTHILVVSELKKEIAKLRETGASSTKNVLELEARLASSETLRENLATQVEKYERDAAIHEKASHELEAHIAHLEAADHNKRLLEELAQKNTKITELEDRLKAKAQSHFEQKDKELSETDEAEHSIQNELDSKFAMSEISSGFNTRPVTTPPCERADALALVGTDDPKTSPDKGMPHNQADQESSQLEQLRKELKELWAKYSDSETRIADLTAKLSEASLVQDMGDDMVEVAQSLTEELSQTDNQDEDGAGRKGIAASSADSNPCLDSEKKQTSMRRTSLPLLNRSNISMKQGFRGGRGYSVSKRNRWVAIFSKEYETDRCITGRSRSHGSYPLCNRRLHRRAPCGVSQLLSLSCCHRRRKSGRLHDHLNLWKQN